MNTNYSAECDCDAIHEDIVNEVKKQMPLSKDIVLLANLFKLFGDPTRIQILFALHSKEMCVCDLAVLLEMTKSAVSHQLKSLRLANLVKNRKEGKVVFYSLSDQHINDIFEKGLEHILE